MKDKTDNRSTAQSVQSCVAPQQPHPCPACGHCPTCGRRNAAPPVYPIYPYWTAPYWYHEPSVTWTSPNISVGSGGTSPNVGTITVTNSTAGALL